MSSSEISNTGDEGSYIHDAIGSSSTTRMATSAAPNNDVVLLATSEFMSNYKQIETVSPEKKFEALQTSNGNSLLFSIGSDNVLYVLVEAVQSKGGWQKRDLSSSICKEVFKNDPTSVKSFEASQSPSGLLTIGMVVTNLSNSTDYFFLASNLSDQDLSWLDNVTFVLHGYDNPDTQYALPHVTIVGVSIAETGTSEFVILDLLNASVGTVRRFFIDPKMTGGYFWHIHDVAIDLQADSYCSCLGRKGGNQYVDGLYTMGHIGTDPQFTYQPLFNAFDRSQPSSPSRLHLPGNVQPVSIALCPAVDNEICTDLFAVGNDGSLYYFSSANQDDGAVGAKLVSNTLLNGVKKLYAYLSQEDVVVWGLNGSNQVFYLKCPRQQLLQAGSWSCPVPILAGVDVISPYVNRVDNGNTIFAVGYATLFKMTQSPASTLWHTESVTIEAPLDAKAEKFSSYTTTIQVNDSYGQPVSNQTVQLTTPARVGVYINDLYYVLSATPVQVLSNAAGTLTIVEAVTGVVGTPVSATLGAVQTSVNPMHALFLKASALSTPAALLAAEIQSSNGDKAKLVPPSTSQSDLERCAASMTQLQQAYSSVTSSPVVASGTSAFVHVQSGTTPHHLVAAAAGHENVFVVAVGDLFHWLKSGIEHALDIVKDAASGLYHLVVTIADKVYRAVLDTVGSVVGALEWVFNKIAVGLEKLIQFLLFVFEWGDITRTKKVLKNMLYVSMKDQVGSIAGLKQTLDSDFVAMREAIQAFAGISDFSGLGDYAKSKTGQMGAPNSDSNSPNNFLKHHYESNSSNMQHEYQPEPLPSGVMDALAAALQAEVATLDNALQQTIQLAENFGTMAVEDVLKAVLGILGEVVLNSVKVVVDVIMDALMLIAESAISFLDTPLHIPVVSDILNSFGVKDVSMLDIMAWVVAVPYTIVYKMAKNEAPFPDDATTTFLVNATSLQSVVDRYAAPPAAPPAAGRMILMAVGSSKPAKIVYSLLKYAAGLVTALAGIIGGESLIPGNITGRVPTALANITVSLCILTANLLNMQQPPNSPAVKGIRITCTVLNILNILFFLGPVQSSLKGFPCFKFLNNEVFNNLRGVGAVVTCVITLGSLATVIYHFVDIARSARTNETDTAIVDETGVTAFLLSRFPFAIAANAPGTVEYTIPLFIGLDLVSGCLDVAAGTMQFAAL